MADNTQKSTAGSSNPLAGAISDINQEFREKEVQQKSRELGIPYIDVSLLPINDDLLRLVTKQESLDAGLIPFFRVGKKLRIAVVNSEKTETKECIKSLEQQGLVINLNMCSAESLAKSQENYKRIKEKNTDVATLESQILEKAGDISNEIRKLADIPQKFEEIQSDLALAILHRKAINLRASDIHFENTKKGVRIRGRIDGTLQDFFTLSHSIAKGIIRQIKFNAKIKSNTPGIPADGQLAFQLGDRTITTRISILPETIGESIVMRYLDPKNQILEISKMGFSETDTEKIDTFKELKNGLVIVTGPTGSGKTTTLYSILGEVNTPEKKIITLEDPVEYEVEGIVQSSINPDKGYSFASGLKSCLRQDPDIILIGEIREKETAEIALQASLTGHFVLSTLHTNSAIESIVRLRDLGVPNYLMGSSLKGIIAQRLVRKPCTHCMEHTSFTSTQKSILMNILQPMVQRGDTLPPLKEYMTEGKGCKKCGETGYKGRTVISETISISQEVSKKISEGENINAIKNELEKENQLFFSSDAAVKILQGKTDFKEVVRVLGKDFVT